MPPNVKFYVDDFEQVWDYPEVGKLDFIHWRSLSGSTGDWSKLYGQAFNNLKPGAFLEVHEYDANVYSDVDPNFEKAPWTRSWVGLFSYQSCFPLMLWELGGVSGTSRDKPCLGL